MGQILAGWGSRIVAWLIDFVIVNIAFSIFAITISLPPLPGPSLWGLIDWSFRSAFFFIYWTLSEGLFGRSIGKKAIGIKVVGIDGGEIGIVEAAYESFGKAFLLPIDVLVGWLAFGGMRQRLFNRLSGTIVVRGEFDQRVRLNNP